MLNPTVDGPRLAESSTMMMPYCCRSDLVGADWAHNCVITPSSIGWIRAVEPHGDSGYLRRPAPSDHPIREVVFPVTLLIEFGKRCLAHVWGSIRKVLGYVMLTKFSPTVVACGTTLKGFHFTWLLKELGLLRPRWQLLSQCGRHSYRCWPHPRRTFAAFHGFLVAAACLWAGQAPFC